MAQTVVTFLNENINVDMSVCSGGSNWSVPAEEGGKNRGILGGEVKEGLPWRKSETE